MRLGDMRVLTLAQAVMAAVHVVRFGGEYADGLLAASKECPAGWACSFARIDVRDR